MPVRPTALKEQQGNTEDFDRLNPAPEHEVAGEDGLSHHGEPEVEVIEDGELEVVEEPPPHEDHRRSEASEGSQSSHSERNRCSYGNSFAT